MNAEYRQALNDVERLRINMREVDPELQAAEKRLMSIIKEAKKYDTNSLSRQR